ncbi:hypothetical protein [Proteocatella sphenisci]|uniref:hypothetical protein n=1 Tax=Proteocatella sphenisci TaxID=181070 RepID=UPI00048F51C7|nr:hypothetical protein [Proteocatella sphenisci]
MQNIIYINNDAIQIVSAVHDGNFNIKNHINVKLSRGSIINGTILNKEEIQRHLLEHKEYLKDATVLIDSSGILAKKLELPTLNKKQIQEVLKYELGVQDVKDEYIYDVNVISGKEGASVLGCAVPKSLIESYLNMFKEIDVKISRIDIVTNAITKFVNSQKDLCNSSFILNIIAGENLISFLFENGKYKLSNRNRLMSNPQSEEYINEIFSKLSSMLQFSKSQKSAYEIKASYYIGLGKEKTEKLKTYTQRYESGTRIEEMLLAPNQDAETNAALFHPLAGIFKGKQDINLVEAYKQATQVQKISSGSIVKLSVIAFLVAATLTGYVFMSVNIKNLNNQIETATAYLEDPVTVNKLNEAQMLQAKNVHLNNIITQAELSEKDLENYKVLDKRDIDNVFSIAGTKVSLGTMSYDSTEKTISLTGTTKSELDCSEFVTNLYKIGLFSNVTYKGYSASAIQTDVNSGTNLGMGYSFTAVATLKAGEING